MSDIKRDVVNELHKPARKKFKRRRVIVRGLLDLWQLDIVEMIPFARFNKGYKYILFVIDAFSKYAYAIPLKTKSGPEVATAVSTLFKKKSNIPSNVQTDLGREFYNKHFKLLMTKHGINHYSTYSNLKASIVERLNRTIKEKMWKEFSFQGNYKWLELLPKIIYKYNNSIHSTTNLKPISVNKKNEKQLLASVFSNPKIVDPTNIKFKVGTKVRISKFRHIFSKGYTPNWSNEIFEVIKVQPTNPRTYLIRDKQGETIQGGFYEQELAKVKHDNIYLIEKVLRKKGNQLYVKWLGFSKPSWISASSLR